MKAITLTGFGGPEVMQWTDVEDPQAGPGEVVVDVVATAVNRADLMQREGHYPPPPGASEILGLECSGHISALGSGVTAWHVGDPVCALLASGGYAEKVAVPAGQLLPAPVGIDLAVAGALPEVTCTVWSNVFDIARLARGESLLVHGGGSGIGTMAIQLAKAHGARMLVTAGSEVKLRRCVELGADVPINYRDEDFVERAREATGGKGVDVILDNMGAKYLARNLDALAVDGRLVVIGLQGGRKAELDLGLQLVKRAAVHATSLRGRPVEQKSVIVSGTRHAVWPLLESGAVNPVVHTRLPLAKAAEAHALVEASDHIGKVLLVNDPA